MAQRRAAYLIPNMFTALALLAGFYAIIKAMDQEFMVAGWAIVFAAFMDMLDGRVARMIDARSDFGAEFDSLSDVVCFGVAPAVLAHQWGIGELGRLGFAAGFFFTAAAAVRLARFNVMQSKSDPRFFRGLPSPIAGIILATGVLSMNADPPTGVIVFMLLLQVFIAVTMVSDLKYYSFKNIDVRASISDPFRMLIALALVSLTALLLLEFRASGVFFFCLLYQFSGYLFLVRQMVRQYSRYRSMGGKAKPMTWLLSKMRKSYNW